MPFWGTSGGQTSYFGDIYSKIGAKMSHYFWNWSAVAAVTVGVEETVATSVVVVAVTVAAVAMQ